MPKYRVTVDCEWSGQQIYEVDASTPEAALEIAKAGEVAAVDEEMQCDKSEWDEAIVDKID